MKGLDFFALKKNLKKKTHTHTHTPMDPKKNIFQVFTSHLRSQINWIFALKKSYVGKKSGLNISF